MKITGIFLLLSVCSVSTEQPQMETEILEKYPSPQQPCEQLVRTGLGEVIALLVQQRVDIQLLQRQSQEQAAKLKEVEEQRAEVDKLKQQAGQVAFSASLVAEREVSFGPSPSFSTLIFKHVVTNAGNAYNSNSGVFTAPVSGVYHFEWHIGAPGHGKDFTAAGLFKNGKNTFCAYEHQSSHYSSSSNSISLLLELGDTVSVQLWTNAKVYDNLNHHTTFSGHLLFTV
ncbi:complement C1q-like protein 4 [Anabas testudineus]|uniref:C1q domain-containing protein n=1 Tax=Anabas testudineus TaxID=64144 RepID=A0A3Q1IMX1_ANATE|nr:complement C1q-like protein 4 [Anabas testudineus]